MKYVGTNLSQNVESLYTENYKTLLSTILVYESEDTTILIYLFSFNRSVDSSKSQSKCQQAFL